MNAVWASVITGLGGSAVAFAAAWWMFRGKKVEQQTEESKIEATATNAFLDGQKAFQEYVNGVVAERVKAAVSDLQQQVTDLEAAMTAMRLESHEMNDAIRARETQLWLWNIRNRPGPMPELPTPILTKLGIGHLSPLGDLEDTTPV